MCPKCGISAGSSRLRGPVPRKRSEFQGPSCLPLSAWIQERSRWARILRVPVARIQPAARIGPPRGGCRRSTIDEDVVHPFPGVIWVSNRVRSLLAREKFSGVRLVRVRLPGECESPLWELVVEGRAWRRGSSVSSIIACRVCGRLKFPRPAKLDVDPGRWDGSDFFHVDENPLIVIVTERVANLLRAKQVSNVSVEPIGTRTATRFGNDTTMGSASDARRAVSNSRGKRVTAKTRRKPR
jgi:hypothetical protein